ncbi:MAG: hypothetical protein IJV26_08595 [Lachnospiraceae bacterium]|nr:hypothetical protein [Lachnospiraceae bacterium]
MKMMRIQKLVRGLLLSAAVAVASMSIAATAPAAAVSVRAEQTITVSGTIQGGTTDQILKVRTSGGDMLIKIDSSTDFGNSKVLLPGKTVTLEVYRGSDAYMHAAKITGAVIAQEAVVDKVNTAVVNGTIADGTTDSLLKLNTSGGQMLIKMDSSTDLSNCHVLVLGRQLSVTIGRGSDAYMHAIKIVDGALAAAAASGSNANISGTMVQGTVADGTNDGLLKLNTAGGQMHIKIDGNTDYSQGKVLVPGLTVGVDFYRGEDAYNHAKKIVGLTPANSGASLDGARTTVAGTVAGGTNESVLFLSTSGGTMQIKLDQGAATPGVLTLGKSVKLTVARGSDAFMHAVSFDGASGAAASGGGVPVGAQLALAQGTVVVGTNESILFLSTPGGTMQFKVDATSNLAACQAMVPGNYLAVAYYRGNDAWNHVAVAVNSTAPTTALTSNQATAVVTGVVGEKTTANLLYLNTNQGQMQIKIDNNTNMGNVRTLLLGKTVKVAIVRGNDAYNHAVTITY